MIVEKSRREGTTQAVGEAKDGASKGSPAKAGYHHGDLRAAALDEGLRQLEHLSVEQLSLRDIARKVGVSATALYRHFPDKDALMGAIASRGFEMLADAQREAMTGLPPSDAFAASGRAYVRFAIAKPSLFRMIFSCAVAQTHPFETAPDDSAAGLLIRNVAKLMGQDTGDDERLVAAMRAWALVHGLAMLILDGQVRLTDIDALIEQVIPKDCVDWLLQADGEGAVKPARKKPSSKRGAVPK